MGVAYKKWGDVYLLGYVNLDVDVARLLVLEMKKQLKRNSEPDWVLLKPWCLYSKTTDLKRYLNHQ